jgi:hypothetical protein
MKTISKYDFTKDKYVVLDEKEHLVLELETGEQYIATPLDFPEEEIMLQTPQEFMEGYEKLLKQADEFASQFQKMIFGDNVPTKEGKENFVYPLKDKNIVKLKK